MEEAEATKQDKTAYRKSAEAANGRVEELTEQLRVYSQNDWSQP